MTQIASTLAPDGLGLAPWSGPDHDGKRGEVGGSAARRGSPLDTEQAERAAPRRAVMVLFAVSLVALTVALVADPVRAAPAEPTESEAYRELSEFVAGLECPQLGAASLELDPRPFGVVGVQTDGVIEPQGFMSFSCSYTSTAVAPADNNLLRVSISVTFDSESVPRECSAEPRESRDDPQNQSIGLGRVADSAAVSIDYSVSQALLDAHPNVSSQIPERFAALSAAFEARAAVCQYDPPPIVCPAVDGFVDDGVEEPRLDHLLRARCSYAPTDPEEPARLELTAFWATDRSNDDAQRRACEDFGTIARPRLGVLAGDGTTSQAQWRFDGPVDSALLASTAFDAAADELRATMAEHTVECRPEWMVSPWTPLPPYLAEIYTAERVDALPLASTDGGSFFAGGADLRVAVTTEPPPPGDTGTTLTTTGTTTNSDIPVATDPMAPVEDGDAATDDTTTPAVAVNGDGGGGNPLLGVLTIVGLVLSLLALGLALVLIRASSRIRPRLDVARVVIVVAVAAVMLLVFSQGAPWWAVVAALAVGAALGWFQGANLEIRLVDGRLMAKRSGLAMVVFAASLVVSQIAGLLNRTGVVALGIALSFLSAATTAGLIAGRRPKVQAARATATVMLVLVVAGPVVATAMLAVPGSAGAQDGDSSTPTEEIECRGIASVVPGERCDAHEYLIDLVDWGSVELSGGLLWDRGKPWAEIEVPRALDEIPEPITRDVEWAHAFTEGGDPTTYTLSESFTFDVTDEGLCCAVFYDGTALEVNARGTETDYVMRGRLDDIEPIGSGIENTVSGTVAPGVPFGEANRFSWEPEGSCRRPVAGTVANMSRDDADLEVNTRNGEPWDPNPTWTAAAVTTDCDLEGFTVDAALERAPELAPRDRRSSPCPAAMELYPALEGEGFEMESVKMIGQLFTRPYEAVCREGGLFSPLTFGPPQPGRTRSEFAFEYASTDDQTVWGDDSAVTDLLRPADIPADDRCETDDSGRAVPLPEGETCELITMHQIDDQGSFVWVFTDNQTFDGPNVTIRASMPWGSYWYNCHHCSVDSPEVQRFLGQFHDVTIDWLDSAPRPATGDVTIDETGDVGAPDPTTAPADPELDDGGPPSGAEPGDDPAASVDSADDTSDDTSDDGASEAALAALAGLLGATGILGTAIAESGRSPAEILDAFRRDGLSGLSGLVGDDLPPGAVVDEWGQVLVPGDDGLYDWETPDGTERIPRDELQERIAAARAADDARQERIDAIVAEQWSDEAAAERFGDLLERTIAENDALMEEIRVGWDEVDRLDSQLARRDAALSGLEVAEAEQELARTRTSWDQVTLDAVEGMGRDVAGLPGEIVDATRVVVTEAADPENWRIAGETVAETIYDTLGVAAGNTFGDGAESIGNGVRFGGELAAALAEALARDPVGTIAALTPINDFANAVDPDRTLGERLGNLGIGLADVAATLAGAGLAGSADDLLDAARVAEAAQDAVGAGRDVARATGALEDGLLGTARVGDDLLPTELLAQRDQIVGAIDAARARAAATGVPVREVLADVPEARSLFQGAGMHGMGALEQAGGLSDEVAAAVVQMHDEITGRAIDLGTRNAIDEMYELTGVRPREVLIGNSGSVGAGRSVMTDADRTAVLVFSDDQLDAWRASRGGTRADAQEALQNQFRDLQRRHAELALNDPSDPAVVLARQEGLTLDEAVARLQAAGADDPAAAAVRLTGEQMDMQTYSGFGSLSGADDLYPAGFTQSRQSIQGSAEVYRIDPDTGAIASHPTSPQAIIDQHELNRLQATGSLTASETELGIAFSDPTRIPDAELAPLFQQQVQAIEHYDDVKSIAKAVDRVEYIASRTGTRMADPTLVEAAVAIRANPRATADVLAGLDMTEQQFVEACQTMVRSFEPGV